MFCGPCFVAPFFARKLSNIVTCTPESLFEFLSSVGPDGSWGTFVADLLGGVCVYSNLDWIIVGDSISKRSAQGVHGTVVANLQHVLAGKE